MADKGDIQLVVTLDNDEVAAFNVLRHYESESYDTWDMIGAGNRDILKKLMAQMAKSIQCLQETEV